MPPYVRAVHFVERVIPGDAATLTVFELAAVHHGELHPAVADPTAARAFPANRSWRPASASDANCNDA